MYQHRKILGRDLMHWSAEEAFEWCQPNDRVLVELDDGLHELRARRLFFSYMHWSLHAQYPQIPLVGDNLLDRRKFSSGSSVDLQSVSYKQAVFALPEVNREDLWHNLYSAYDRVYQFMTKGLEEYVTTITSFDFYELMEYPPIKKLLEESPNTREGIKSCYDGVSIIIKTHKQISHNNICKAVRIKPGLMGQVLQCIAKRGFITDVNSEIFRDPVIRPYAAGLLSLPDSMKESRSAAKSLLYNKEQISKSERFGRELQIASAVVQRLHVGDCGSTDTIPFKIKSARELELADGKYYIDGSELKIISENDRELIGRTVRMRTVTRCWHPDPAGICSVCFGTLENNFALTDNIGDAAARNTNAQVTSNILGTKHHDGSSTVESAAIPPEYQHLFRYNQSDPNALMLSKGVKGKHVLINMKLAHVNMLYDIAEGDDLSKLVPKRLFEVGTCEVEVRDDAQDSVQSMKVNFAFTNRPVVPSKAFIRYLKRHSWTVSSRGIVTFDLGRWDHSRSLFQMPLIHRNMLSYAEEVEREFKFALDSTSQSLTGSGEATPEEIGEVLGYWHTLCAQRLKVNLSHLDVMLYASMIRSPHQKDYRMPKRGTTQYFSTFLKNINHRSLSMKLAHQEQIDAFQNPNSYISTKKPDFPGDNVFLPTREPKPQGVMRQ